MKPVLNDVLNGVEVDESVEGVVDIFDHSPTCKGIVDIAVGIEELCAEHNVRLDASCEHATSAPLTVLASRLIVSSHPRS